MTYPEHEKLEGVGPEIQAVHEFLEWLGGHHGGFLAKHEGHHAYPFDRSDESLVAEWAGIDPQILENEKREMLRRTEEERIRRVGD